MSTTPAFPAPATSRRSYSVEPLETRVLMSADIGLVLPSLSGLVGGHGVGETPDGDLIFGDPVTADHGLVLDGSGALVFEDGLVVHGDLVLTHATNVTFHGSVEVTGNVIIDAAGTVLFGSLFHAGGAVALAADEIDFLGGARSVGIAGDLIIKSHTAGLPIQVGFTADATGSLGLTDADLAALNGGGKVVIGDAGGSVLVDSAEFSNDVSITGSDVTIQHGLLAKGAHVALAATGIVRNDGLIDVSARASGGAAGAVHLTGKYAGNFGTILALGSDTTAGGVVTLDSTVQTLVTTAGVIDASGGAAGGTIKLWSDTNTTMAGTLSARGGLAGGNGGFVEVSSADGFSLSGHVDTTAAIGTTGTLLLDPKNVIIANSGGGTLAGVDQFSDTPGTDVTINVSTITGAGAGVVIQANNDITVNAAISMAQNLTLQAGRSVLINQSITLSNKTLTIIANDDAGTDANRDAGLGAITTVAGAILNAGSGAINLTLEKGDVGAAGGITIDKVITTGTLTVSTAGFVRETNGDTAPASGAMQTEDDLVAGTLSLIVTASDASFGQPTDQGNGALEVAAGTINADVGLVPKTDFTGFFVLADVDHTNGETTIEAPMMIGTFNAGSGSVILTAKGASIRGTAGGTPNITATQVNLTTEKIVGPDVDAVISSPTFLQPLPHYGSIGTSGTPLRTDVALLTATAAGGGVFIAEANDVMINKVTAQDQGVTPQTGANGKVVIWPSGGTAAAGTSNAVLSAGGSITLLDVKVANQLVLTAGGLIADGNQETTNILAQGLTVIAGGAIGNASDAIETMVMTLQASTTNGGVFISEGDGAQVTSIAAGGAASDVILSNAVGPLELGTVTAARDVTVKAQFETITDSNGAAVNITAATATLEARTGLGTVGGDPLEVSVGKLTTKVKDLGVPTYVSNTGGLTALSVETNNGPVDISFTGGTIKFEQPGIQNQLSLTAPAITTFSFSNNGGNVALKSVNAGTGTVSITASAAIIDHATDTLLDLTAGTVTLKAGTFIGTASNHIETNVDNLTATALAGGIYIDDTGGIASLNATATGAGSDISVTTVGDLFVTKVISPDDVNLDAGGNLRRIGNVLNISGATATLHAGLSIGLSAEPLVLQVNTLNSAIASNGGTFLRFKSAVAVTTVRATGGDLEVAADGDLTLGLAEVDSSHTAKISSTYGAILDGNTAAINVRGGTAIFAAVSIATFVDPLDTDIGTLTAVASGGDIYLNELNTLNVLNVEAQGLGSDVFLTAGGSVTLDTLKADGDQVKLTVTSGAIIDGNGPLTNITADLLDISAPGGIGSLQNSVNRLGSANGGVTGVTMSNLGPLAITDTTLEGRGSSPLRIQADSITILDMADDMAALDLNGSLQLVSLTGNIIFLDPNDTIKASGTGTIAISAGLGITPDYPDTGAVAVVGNLITAGGAIEVSANHHITIGLLDTGGSGNVTVTSETGVILDGNGPLKNIRGNVVKLSGALPTARQAQLETSIRIADYSAARSEAASKFTTAQSLSTATAIMDIQQENALKAKDEASDAKDEAESDSESKDAAALAAYITATVLDGVATALGIARDIVAIPAGVAQAIPLTGDGGAMTGYSALDVASNVADAAAFAAGIVSDQLGDAAEEAANALIQASAELTALSATFEDSLATWKAFSEATSVAQKASDAAEIARDHSLVVRNQAIFAEDQGNVIGSADNSLQIEAQKIDAIAKDGSVFLSVTGNVNLGGISATGTGGVVSVKATGDIYVIGTTAAPSGITLDAGGSIIEAGGSVQAPQFLGLAQLNVGTVANPILTTASTLAVHALTGAAGINNTGALEIGSINGVDGVTTAGAVGITSSGSMTFMNVISAPNQAITLLSQNGAIIDAHTGSAEVTGSSLDATAKTGIELDTDLASLKASVTSAGSVKVREASGITLTSVLTANGPISVEAGGTIVATSVVSTTDNDANDILLKTTVGGIQAGTINAGAVNGDVTLDASATGGAITMLGGGRITADAFVATADTGINVKTTTKSATLEVLGTGLLTVDEFDALLVNKLKTANGAIDLKTGGQVTLVEGAVNAKDGASDVKINAAGKIVGPLTGNGSPDILGAIVNLITTGASSTVGTTTTNPLEINATTRLDVSTANSSAFIDDTDAGVVVGLANVGTGNFFLKAIAGSITATAPGNAVADIVAAQIDLKVTGTTSTIGTSETNTLDINGTTLTVLTEGGSAFLADTAGGLAINTLNVGTGDLFLKATGGAITDNNDAGSAINNIVATNLMLSATAGVGTSVNAIEAKATALEGLGGTGGFYLTDLADGIVIGGVTNTLTGVSVTGGSIVITALSPLTVNEPVKSTGGGSITLTATDSAATGEDLKINADITVTGGSGGINLYGGDDVELVLGKTVTTLTGTVDIRGDNADADPGVGSQIELNGTIRANRLQVTSYSDDDTLFIKDVVVATHSISTGSGDDEVTITSGNTLGTGTLDVGAGDDTVTTSSPLQNFVGGNDNDLMLVKKGGSVTSSAGGGSGSDRFVYDHDGLGSDDFIGPVTVNLQTQVGTSLASFSSFEDIEATTNANDQLIGANATSAWHIIGTNAGDIGGPTVFAFSEFENLTGGNKDDVFQFAVAGSIGGNLDGGGHTLRDKIDYDGANFDAQTTVTLDGPIAGLATAIGGRFDRIDEVIGDADFVDTNSLTGDAANNTWTFTGLHAGNISNHFFFQQFGVTIGGSADDYFAFADNTLPPQPVNGGLGHNTLDLSAWTSDLGWNIMGDGSGTVTTKAGSFQFTGMTTLIGGSAADRFTFADDKILGHGLTDPGVIIANGGNDFIDMAAYTTDNRWTRTGLDGTITTGRGTWTYSSIEGFLGSKTTTFLFNVIDLTGKVTRVGMAPQLYPTQGGTVSMTLTNLGNDQALGRHIDISYYLSLDGTLGAGDVLIGKDLNRSINLLPGENYPEFSVPTQVPVGTAAGQYHVLTLIDSANDVFEGDESNNLLDGGLIEVLPIQVDLKPTLTTATFPAHVLPGSKGTLTASVANLGPSVATGAIDVEFFLSLDGTIGAGDIALGGVFDSTISIAGGGSRAYTFTAQVPAGTTAADYQVLVRVDGKGNVLESNETNNVAAFATALHVETPFIDLTGDFTRANLPNLGVPGDVLNLVMPIKNVGNIAAAGKVDVNFYLSVDGTVSPGTDTLLKSLHNVALKVGANGQQYVTATAPIPAILNGTYFVLADIDATNTVGEATETNNTAVLSDGLEVVWRFGNFADRENVKLKVPDAHGNLVTFTMNGQGVGNVLGGPAFTELSFTGTDAATTVGITTAGGAVTEIHEIRSTNSINTLNAPKVKLLGDLTINGSTHVLTLGDVVGPATISFGTPANAFQTLGLKFGHVENAQITSATPIRTLAVTDWLDNDMAPDVITAPWIGAITAAGNFQADLLATGANAGVSLTSLNVKGTAQSNVKLAGGALAITVGGWSGGTLDATFAKTFTVKGDLQQGRLLLSGAGLTATEQALGTLAVTGRVSSSLIDVRANAGSVVVGTWGAGSILAVGVGSGGDGTYFDNNETALGGTLGKFVSTNFDTANGGTAFGIVADQLGQFIQLNRTTKYLAAALPVVNGDLRLKVL